MDGHEYIVSKQIQWALNHKIRLIGSKGDQGRKAYTTELKYNLFEPLEELTQNQFSTGNGNETVGSPMSPAKMQALHSSSALGVNIFQYWQKSGLTDAIAAACGFCNKGSEYTTNIDFEDKYVINTNFIIPPNIDVVFHCKAGSPFHRFAVECKFSEAYSSIKHEGLKDQYLGNMEIWAGLPFLHELAVEINPVDHRYRHLHAAQLIKHILGLKAVTGQKDFKLMYLWYDVLGKEGADHRTDIEDFISVAKKDEIRIHAKTYQELIVLLARDYRDEHPEYITYLTERYL